MTNEDSRNKGILSRSKKILLQMASPESLIRLQYTSLDEQKEKLSEIYYVEQHHGSIVEFLSHHLNTSTDSYGLLIQVSITQLRFKSLIIQVKLIKLF